MRTISATIPDPHTRTDSEIQDIAFEIVDGLESVRQRVILRLQFWFKSWFLDQRKGVPYREDILGHAFDESLARSVLIAQMLDVADVTAVRELELSVNGVTRVLSISATVDTIYGPVAASVRPSA